MENASKALIMAGETLIALLVAGLIAYSITTFGSFSKDINSEMENSRTSEFNSHFLQYEGRADITVDEIVTIINFAKHSNDDYELYLENGYTENKKSMYFTDVYVEGASFFSGVNKEADYQNKIQEFLNTKNKENNFYMCNLNKIVKSVEQDLEGITKVSRQGKTTPPYDISFDSNIYGSGRVNSIKFYITDARSVEDFDPIHRDQFYIE